jgi:hypothetical protein
LQFSSNFLKQPILLVNQWFPRPKFIDCWQCNYAWYNMLKMVNIMWVAIVIKGWF